MKYKAVIFDLFGTLIDNLSPVEYERTIARMADALSVSSADLGRLWFETAEKRNTGFFGSVEDTVRHMCEALRAQAAEAQIREASEIRIDFTRRALAPRPEAIEVLTQLRSKCKVGLISDCSDEVPLLWPETAFAPLFDAAIFSCSVGMKKPDSRIYHFLCERLGVAPADCLYIGDGSSRELTGAAKVGMQPVLISVPYDNDYDHYRIDAKEWQGRVISSLSGILAVAEQSDDLDRG
jgi:putative hydrolase of the HAD superfamily